MLSVTELYTIFTQIIDLYVKERYTIFLQIIDCASKKDTRLCKETINGKLILTITFTVGSTLITTSRFNIQTSIGSKERCAIYWYDNNFQSINTRRLSALVELEISGSGPRSPRSQGLRWGRSGIKRDNHEGWDLPLVNMMFVSKGESGRWKYGRERWSVEVKPIARLWKGVVSW